VINQAQKCHELEYTSYHRKSQNLTHGGGWEGQNPAKSISEKSTQSYPRKGHENVQGSENQLKGPVNWLPRTFSCSKERIDKGLVEDWQIIKRRLKN
jgi:hypothetical protein